MNQSHISDINRSYDNEENKGREWDSAFYEVNTKHAQISRFKELNGDFKRPRKYKSAEK